MTWDITGMGAVANLGTSPREIFDRLCMGVDGRSELQCFELDRYRMHHAYEIRDRRRPGVDEPFRATRWLVAAVRQALEDASLPPDLAEVPVLIGTTMREQRTTELWWREETPPAPSRQHFGPALREAFGCAATYTLANACAASVYALGLGADLLDMGAADTVVVAGTDSMTESAFGMLDRVQDGTPDGLRPFDESHRGVVMGEGAVAVVLQRRGAGVRRVRARLRAVAMNCDAHHATAPHRAGILAAIREAHRRAGIGPEQVGLVMLHGTATPLNDATEAAVLAECFGGCPSPPVMTAIKSMTGHTLGGSGLLSLVVAVHSWIPAGCRRSGASGSRSPRRAASAWPGDASSSRACASRRWTRSASAASTPSRSSRRRREGAHPGRADHRRRAGHERRLRRRRPAVRRR